MGYSEWPCDVCGNWMERTNSTTVVCKECRDKLGIAQNCSASLRFCEFCGKEFQPTGNRQTACKICIPSPKWRAIYRRYGITKPQWDEMYEKQNGRCGICEGSLFEDATTHVDHCHIQGHNRELLCNICNFGLGFVENDKWMGQAFKYIERNKR